MQFMVALVSLHCILWLIKRSYVPFFMQSNVNFFLSAIAKITSCLGGPIALLDLQSAGKNEIHFITNCD